MHILWTYLRPHGKLALLALLLAAVSQVLALIVQGLSNKDMARVLELSPAD